MALRCCFPELLWRNLTNNPPALPCPGPTGIDKPLCGPGRRLGPSCTVPTLCAIKTWPHNTTHQASLLPVPYHAACT